MNSYSYYETPPLPLRPGHLDRRHARPAGSRTSPSPPRPPPFHVHPFRRQFLCDGLAGAPSLPRVPAFARAMARRRYLSGASHAAPRPFLERLFRDRLPQHVPGSFRSLRRMDADLLRRRAGGRDDSGKKRRVKPRPNLLAGEDLPPEPLQKRSIAKRGRLKAAALALFGEKGYERTSVDDVARRARLAVGGFY